MEGKYCITIVSKILITQFVLSFIGLMVGCMWGLHIENRKWSQLFYSDIKIADIFLGDKTKEKASYIDKVTNMSPVKSDIEMKVKGVQTIDSDSKGYEMEKERLGKYIKNTIKTGVNEDIQIKPSVKNKEDALTQGTLSLINTCISSFSTNFESSSSMRANNIEICVKAINGILLMPGESFSFNEVVGERTKERGYMEAPVIIGNKVESGIGGGICQVSTTLYNAILRSGLQHIERTHHSLPSSYVGFGLDATVDWGNIDFKFINTLDYPIYIEGHTQNKNLYINIFSNSNLNKNKYVIENNIKENNNFCKVEVIRKTYEDGMLIDSEFISNDEYRSVASGVKQGTKN